MKFIKIAGKSEIKYYYRTVVKRKRLYYWDFMEHKVKWFLIPYKKVRKREYYMVGEPEKIIRIDNYITVDYDNLDLRTIRDKIRRFKRERFLRFKAIYYRKSSTKGYHFIFVLDKKVKPNFEIREELGDDEVRLKLDKEREENRIFYDQYLSYLSGVVFDFKNGDKADLVWRKFK